MLKKKMFSLILVSILVLLSLASCINTPVIPFVIEFLRVQGINITQQGEIITVGIGNTDVEFNAKVNAEYLKNTSIKVWAGLEEPVQLVAESADLSNPAFWLNVEPGEYSVRVQITGPNSKEANYYFVVKIETHLALKKLAVNDKTVRTDSTTIEINPGETFVFAEYNDTSAEVDITVGNQKFTNPCTFTAYPKTDYEMVIKASNSDEATENKYLLKTRQSNLDIVDVLVDGIYVTKDKNTVNVNEGQTNVFAEANDESAEFEFELNGTLLSSPRGGNFQFIAESNKKYTLKIKATKDVTTVERVVNINVLQGISSRVSYDSVIKIGEKTSPETFDFIVNSENVDFVEAWLEFPQGHPNSNPNMKKIGEADVSVTDEAVFNINPLNPGFMAGIPGHYLLWAKTVEDQTFHTSSAVNLYAASMNLKLQDVGYPDDEIYTTEEYHRFKIEGELFPGLKARTALWELTLLGPDGNPVSPVPYTNSVTSGEINESKEGTLTTYIPTQKEFPMYRLSENGLYTAILSATCEFGQLNFNKDVKVLIHYSGNDPLKIDNLLVNGIEIPEGTESIEIKPGSTDIFADTNYSNSEISINVENYNGMSQRTASAYKTFEAQIGNQYEVTVTATKNTQNVIRKVILNAKNGISMNVSSAKAIIVDDSQQIIYPESVNLSLYSADPGTVQVYLKLPQGHPKGQGIVGPVYEYNFAAADDYATFNVDVFDQNYIDSFDGDYEYYAKALGADFSASDTLSVMTAEVTAELTDSTYIELTSRGTDTYHQFTVNGTVFPGTLTESTSWDIKVLDPLGNDTQFLPNSGPVTGKADQTKPGTLTTHIEENTRTALIKMSESGTYTAILTVNGSFDDDTFKEAQAINEFFYESAPDLAFEEVFVSGVLLKDTDEGTELVFEPGKVSIYAAANYNDADITMNLQEEQLASPGYGNVSRGKMFEFDGIAGKRYKITLTAKKGVTTREYVFYVKIPREINMNFNDDDVVLLGNPKTQPENVTLTLNAADYPNKIVEIWILPPEDNPNYSLGRRKYFEIALNATGNATLILDMYANPFVGVEGKYDFYTKVLGEADFQSSKILSLHLPWIAATISDEGGNPDTEYSSEAYHRFRVDAKVFPGVLAKDCTWKVEVAGENGGQAEIVPLGGGELSGKVDTTMEGTLTLKTATGLETALLRLSQTDTYTASLTVEGVFNENDKFTFVDTMKIYYEDEPPQGTLTILSPQNTAQPSASLKERQSDETNVRGVNINENLVLLLEAHDQLVLGDITCNVEKGTVQSEEIYKSPDETTYRATITYAFSNIDGATITIDVNIKDKAGLEKNISKDVFVDVVAPRVTQDPGSVLFLNLTPNATEIDFITDFKIKEATLTISDPDSLLQSYEATIVRIDDSNYTVYATFTAKTGVAEGNIVKSVIATDTSDNCTKKDYLLKVDTKGPEPITPITGMIVFGEGEDYITLPFHEQILQETLVATLTIGNLKYSIDNLKTTYIPGSPFIYRTYYNCDLTTNPQPTIDIFVKDLYQNSSYNTGLPVNVQTNSSPGR